VTLICYMWLCEEVEVEQWVPDSVCLMLLPLSSDDQALICLWRTASFQLLEYFFLIKVDVHYCVNFCCAAKWFRYIYIYIHTHSFLRHSFLLWFAIGYEYRGFPGGTSSKEPACQCRKRKRRGFSPCVGKIPWWRAWQPTPVFSPAESYGQRSLSGYSPWGHKGSDTTEVI